MKADYTLSKTYSKLMNYIEIPEDNQTSTVGVSYLEYVEMPKKNPGDITEIGLKCMTEFITLDKVPVKVGAAEDPGSQIDKHLMKAFLDRIKAAAETNAMDALVVNASDELQFKKRRMASRVLSGANLIATKGRRGPATYVILSPANGKLLQFEQEPVGFDAIWRPSSMFMDNYAGLDIFLSNAVGDNVIIGRYLGKDEPGLHLVSSAERLSGDLVIGTDIESVEIEYAFFERPGVWCTQFKFTAE